MAGCITLRSIAEKDAVAGCRWATVKERERERLDMRRKSSTIFHRELRLVKPHSWLWALKSPRNKTGGRSWPIMSSSSVILYVVEGERYMEHMVIVLWQVALSAMACRPLLMCNYWWGVVFFHKYCYTTMKRAIIFHSRYTVVWIVFEGICFVTME